MSHFVNIGGTEYEVIGGRTLVDGTEREILLGKTLIDGTECDIPFKIKVTINFDSSTTSGHGYIKVDGQTYNFDDQSDGSLTVRVPYGSEIYAYVGYNTYGSSYIYHNGTMVAGQGIGAYPYELSYSFNATSDIDITFRMSVTAGTSTTTKKFYNRIYINDL